MAPRPVLNPKIKLNMLKVVGQGYQCFICKSILKTYNGCRDHVRCHLEPEFKKKEAERMTVKDQKRSQKLRENPERLERKRNQEKAYAKRLRSTTEGVQHSRDKYNRYKRKFPPSASITYKSQVAKRFKHLIKNKVPLVAPDYESQELTSRADFLGNEIVEECWDILKDPLKDKPSYTYCFLMVDPIAKDMGLVAYLSSVRYNPDVTLATYHGKNTSEGKPSQYHKYKHAKSKPREYCAEHNLIAYVIVTEKFNEGNRVENKMAAETAEYFWQHVGQLQKIKRLPGRVQWKTINEVYDVAPLKDNKTLDKALVAEATHVAWACDGIICLDFIAGECEVTHNKNGLCRHYGKKHLDLNGVEPFDFECDPTNSTHSQPGTSKSNQSSSDDSQSETDSDHPEPDKDNDSAPIPQPQHQSHSEDDFISD